MDQDATGTKQDGLPEDQGLPSDGETKPSEETPEVKVYTQEDVDKAMAERHSALDKEIASLKKQVAQGELTAQQLKDVKAELARLNKEREEQEYEEAKTDPGRLAEFKRKQDLAKREADLVGREEKLRQEEVEKEELIEAGYKVKRIEAAQEIVKDFPGVEASALLEADLKTPEEMRVFAKTLAGVKGAEKPPVLAPDSGLGDGAGGKPSIEQLESMTMEQYAAYVKKRDEKK